MRAQRLRNSPPARGFPQWQFSKEFTPPGENRIQFNVEPGTRRFALLAETSGNERFGATPR